VKDATFHEVEERKQINLEIKSRGEPRKTPPNN